MAFDNGGSAFPPVHTPGSGMSLRDYFAAQVIAGILAASQEAAAPPPAHHSKKATLTKEGKAKEAKEAEKEAKELAAWREAIASKVAVAYEYADIMLTHSRTKPEEIEEAHK